jgi:hypothetical protein
MLTITIDFGYFGLVRLNLGYYLLQNDFDDSLHNIQCL